MGHWEQIGRDNAEERERVAALPRWRRLLAAQGRAALGAASWVAVVALAFALIRRF